MTCRTPRTAPRLILGAVLFAGVCVGAAPDDAAGIATGRDGEVPRSTGYSAAALYNLGNSYARAGKPGLAVLNYERARLLAPGDPDIAANLHQVRDASRLPTDPPLPFVRYVTWVGPSVCAWLGVLGVLLAGMGLIVARLAPRYRWLPGLTLPLGLVLVGLTVGNAWVVWPLLHEGVVLAAATPVRVAPVPMGDPLFTLEEADTVTLTADHDEFVLIRTRTGRTGWVARANVAAVVPRT